MGPTPESEIDRLKRAFGSVINSSSDDTATVNTCMGTLEFRPSKFRDTVIIKRTKEPESHYRRGL